MYMHVHNSSVQKNQKTETTQVSISPWMDERIVVYPYNQILYSQQRNKVQMLAAKGMNLENLMLC